MLVDIKYNADLKRHVSFDEMKIMPELIEMCALQRANHLPIMPAMKPEFIAIKQAAMASS
jgi:predicted RNA-binding protein with PUA-like domain